MQTWSQWGTLVKRQKFENCRTITECLLTIALRNRHIRSLRTPSVAGKRIQATSHTARFLETGLCVSTTVDTSLVPEPPGTSPTGPEYKITIYSGTSREIPTKCRMQTSNNSLKQLWEDLLLAQKSAAFQRKRLKSPQIHHINRRVSTPGCTAGSPQGLYTITERYSSGSN